MMRLCKIFTLPLMLLLMTSSSVSAAINEADLLPVEQAFSLSVTASTAQKVELKWKIATDYYMYRERIKVSVASGDVILGELALPQGKVKDDEFFGRVETYRDAVSAQLPVSFLGAVPAQIELLISSQGCADIGVCYPPHKQKITVELPQASGALGVPTLNSNADILGLSSGVNPVSVLSTMDAGPLPAEQAFVVEAISANPGEILARVVMPKGYYLYRDKTTFSVADKNISLAAPKWPPAVAHSDDHFGEVQVYFDLVEVPIKIYADSAAKRDIELMVDLQGCQLDGICYPPMQRSLTLSVSPLAGAMPSMRAAENIAPISEQDGFSNALASGSKIYALLLFFLVGIGLAFTPCVFPMVPILSGIIAGAGEGITTRRAFILSLVYVLATALVFTIVGVIAGMAGQNLQAVLQKPWLLSAFAGLFVLLALSMFGFYELQVPAWVQNRIAAMGDQQKSGSLWGVAIMGVLSALLVGPCVAPPLAGAVLYISQQQDPVLGGAALFAMAMGMGVPLIAFGTGAGKFLPKAGAWMDAVKAVFGVMFLWLAIWMLERVLDAEWIMVLAGMLLIASGVHLRALDRLPEHASGWLRLGKALGFLMLLLGALQIIGVASGGKDYMRPLSGLSGGRIEAAQQLTFRKIKSSDELDQQIATAELAGRPVVFDFYADWCVECKRMEKYTFTDDKVQTEFARFVMLKVDVTDQTPEQVALQQRFKIIGPPATLFFTSGDEVTNERLVGYEDATDFSARLSRIKIN